MKKLYIISLMLVIMLFVAGCTIDGYPLTESESDAIAQYCTHLILKYDKNKNYNEKLLDKKDYEKALINPTEVPTSKPKPTEVPDITQKPDDVPEITNTPDISDVPDISNTPSAIGTDTVPPELSETNTFEKLSDIFDSDFELSYKNYVITDKYYENESSVLTAKEGKKCFVVTFSLKNVSKEAKKFDAVGYDMTYTLYNRGKKIGTSEISAMSRDLRFLYENIDSGKAIDVTLLFYTELEEGDFTLRITDNSADRSFDVNLN